MGLCRFVVANLSPGNHVVEPLPGYAAAPRGCAAGAARGWAPGVRGGEDALVR
jgi:hypothetical protein